MLNVLKKSALAVTLLGTLTVLSASPAGTGDPAALTQCTLSVNGVDRTYSYYVSTKSNSFNGQWVVFALHANGQSAEQFAAASGWPKVAEENGFAVVFPQALNNTWTPASGAEDAYLKAVFDHARTSIISLFPGDNRPSGPAESNKRVGNNGIWAWEPLRDLTGNGAGAVVAQEFAMNHPGLFAAVAPVNGTAYKAAYALGDEPAQAYFQHMRGKNAPPVWKQLKKDVPVSVWMFHTGTATPAQTRQAEYWKHSAAVGPTPTKRTIGPFETTVYQNAANPAQDFRLTTLSTSSHYDEVMSATIWADLFAHRARWTSSPNGDLTMVMTEAEVNKQFEVRKIDVGNGDPYTYYLKLPSSYKKGQKLPLVLSTHGANEQAWLFASKIRMHELGEKEGFITVYPSGHRNRWESSLPDGPDATFIERLIKDVVATYGADESRVYMQGFSNGNMMTMMMGVTRPQLFAAVSPNNGPSPLPELTQKRVDELKAKSDYRIPVMAVYGNVDSGASVDGKILAGPTGANGGIDALKKINHITTADRVEKLDSIYTDPYDILVPQGKAVAGAIDKRYPGGRFQIYEYMSADPKPLNLLDVVWILDLPHAYDLREAKLEWDFFKHWKRNADGTLTYLTQ